MPLIDRIRNATAALHLRTEQTFADCFDFRTSSGYTAVLSAFYGFVAPWEQAIAAAAGPEIQMWMSSRWRKSLLVEDLRQFCIDAGNLPQCQSLPSLTGGRLIGSVYVMEGSRLGGLHISRAVESALGLTTELGRSYFIGDGPTTASRWREFVARLPDFARDCGEAEVIDGACGTFTAMMRWFRICADREAGFAKRADA
jgi:heme oxygenase (biliverdin-IX-beta and delta-forming)